MDLGDLLSEALSPKRGPRITYQPREVKKFQTTTPEAEADKLEAMERPNKRSALNSIDRLKGSGYEVEEAEDALDAYNEVDRSDFVGDPEGYADERSNCWSDFIEVLRECRHEDEDEFDFEDDLDEAIEEEGK